MTEKTYGVMKVTESEYRAAREIVERDHGGPLLESAYQTVRYCRGAIFCRDDVVGFLQAIRAPGGQVLE